jgi:hypothetical protein
MDSNPVVSVISNALNYIMKIINEGVYYELI